MNQKNKNSLYCKILKNKSEINQWDIFLSTTNECPIIQTSLWGKIKKISGWQPIIIGILKNNKIIGGVSILKRKIPFIKKTIFYASRGPVIDFHDENILFILLRKIKKVARKNNAIVLKIDPEISETDIIALEIIKKNNFQFKKKQIQPRATFFIDLTKSLDEILKNCKPKTRYNIRLANRRGVKVTELTSKDGVETFYQIYLKTAKRDSFIIHRKEYYNRILKILGGNKMAHIFIAFYKNKPIAGVFIFTFGKKAWYVYGASSNEYRNVMPNQALHWEVIKWAKEKGYTIYDLWGIPAHPQPNQPMYGVYKFKKGFGGELVRFIGMHDLIYSPFWYHLINSGIKTYVSLRSLIKKGKISDSLGE